MALAKREGGGGLAKAKEAAKRLSAGSKKLAEHRKDMKAIGWGVGAAAAVGYMEGRGMNLPSADALGGPTGTYGAASAAIYLVTGNRTAAHIATGLLSAAIHERAKYGANPPKPQIAVQQPKMAGTSNAAGQTVDAQVVTAGAVDFE